MIDRESLGFWRCLWKQIGRLMLDSSNEKLPSCLYRQSSVERALCSQSRDRRTTDIVASFKRSFLNE